MKLPDRKQPQPPKGKRGIRETIWGNVNAYVAGRFWKTLGPVHTYGIEQAKQNWLDGTDNT
jgi:hypothetical protein